jgi:hypothetical protein
MLGLGARLQIQAGTWGRELNPPRRNLIKQLAGRFQPEQGESLAVAGEAG